VYQFFAPRSSSNVPVRLPEAYREKVRWRPRLGDQFPTCIFNTSQGKANLSDLAGKNWIYLFSLPQAFGPICTAELASFARCMTDFRDLSVQPVVFSQSTIAEQREWHELLETQFGISVDIPFIEDPELSLARCFGMVHPRESEERMIRKSFVLDPQHVVRSLIEYPSGVMRNSAVALDDIRSLQEYDKRGSRETNTASRALNEPMLLSDKGEPIIPRRVTSNPLFRADLAAKRPPANLERQVALTELS